MCDYDSEWDGELDVWHGPYTRKSLESWFTALQYRHVPVDALYLRPETVLEDLARYDVLVYPHPAILTDGAAALLSDYVSGGGTLVFGCRTGYKDEHGHVYMRPWPGPVADLCGVTVADFTRIGPDEAASALRWLGRDGEAVLAESFNDILQVDAPAAEVLAEYAGGYYAGAPALVRNPVGKGYVYYYGAVFSVAAADRLIGELELTSPVHGLLELPPELELCIRESADDRLIFLLNYSDAEQAATLNGSATDLLTGEGLGGAFTLAPYGVRILGDARGSADR